MKIVATRFFLLALLFAYFACSPLAPTARAEAVSQSTLAKNIEVFLPTAKNANDKFPFVIFLETSSGSPSVKNSDGSVDTDNDYFYPWTTWFLDNGVAVVQVHSAAARGLEDWEGKYATTDVCLDYRHDPLMAYQIAIANKKLDANRFALLGQSMGGRQVLNTSDDFANTKLSAVFSFYPACISTVETENKSTSVFCVMNYSPRTNVPIHILYGDKDDWGNTTNAKGQTTISQCRAAADANPNDNIYFHLLKGAYHSFEAPPDIDTSYPAPYKSGNNPAAATAIATAAKIMADTLAPLWKISINPKTVDTKSGSY